jgi:hypothetical protein
MILEGPDGPFGGIPMMDMGCSELKIDVFGLHGILEHGRGFVVKFLEFWA